MRHETYLAKKKKKKEKETYLAGSILNKLSSLHWGFSVTTLDKDILLIILSHILCIIFLAIVKR